MRIDRRLQAFCALPAVLAAEVGYNGRTVNLKRLVSHSLIYPVPTTLPVGFSWAMFFCQDTDHTTVSGSAESPHSTAPLLGSKHVMGSRGFRWSYADNCGVLARGENCTNVHLARLIAGVQKAGLDVHDKSLAIGSADALGCELSPANVYCSGTGKRISRIQSVSRTVSSCRRICGWAMELVNGHESFLVLSNRGALSILDASFNFARTSYLVS